MIWCEYEFIWARFPNYFPWVTFLLRLIFFALMINYGFWWHGIWIWSCLQPNHKEVVAHSECAPSPLVNVAFVTGRWKIQTEKVPNHHHQRQELDRREKVWPVASQRLRQIIFIDILVLPLVRSVPMNSFDYSFGCCAHFSLYIEIRTILNCLTFIFIATIQMVNGAGSKVLVKQPRR